MTTRRSFLLGATAGAGVVAAGAYWQFACSCGDRVLIDRVAEACARLAPLGWRQMLLDVTGGELDIRAKDLRGELVKSLGRIDRTYPGFGDFATAGASAIEAGRPERSLLYHAFASAGVAANRHGLALGDFPTLAEIDAVENYVYGVAPPSYAAVQSMAKGRPLAIVTFALQYRNTPNSVHGRHAELCFSRAGVARLGTIEAKYDARARAFDGLDPARPFAFRVIPQRFAAYLAVQMKGDSESFGPQDFIDGKKEDEARSFWVPIHKLFSGRECIEGFDLTLCLERDVRNDELARFHKYLDVMGYRNNWRGDDLENFPFLIRNEKIASLSTRPSFGPGVLEPKPAPLAVTATYQGKKLTFPVDPNFTGDPVNLEFSSLQPLPTADSDAPSTPTYMYDISDNTQRPAPEYLNLRHRVLANGATDNLNRREDMMAIIKRGGYQAQHYIDFTGDGWIQAHCRALEALGIPLVPAYCMISPPDFFPKVSQRDLMLWWKSAVPATVRDALWAIPPKTLSQTRIAANVDLPIGFAIGDVTVTSIVTQPHAAAGAVQLPNSPVPEESTGLPDASPGIFDPGWDTSMGIYFTDKDAKPLEKFLEGYGLGSPFIEDAKLCAALGAYWPGVSPDATRTFQPDKLLGGISYPWPTVAPLTDEEIGISPVAGDKYMPWDGVRGPSIRKMANRSVVAYTDAMRADYLDLMGTMTAALTSRIDLAEYKARVMAMAAVYWGLGIHDPDIQPPPPPPPPAPPAIPEPPALTPEEAKIVAIVKAKSEWAVRSFRSAAPAEQELAAAEAATGHKLSGSLYRFEVYKWDPKKPAVTDPKDLSIVLVEMTEQAVFYVGGTSVLLKRGEQPWTFDNSMPT